MQATFTNEKKKERENRNLLVSAGTSNYITAVELCELTDKLANSS